MLLLVLLLKKIGWIKIALKVFKVVLSQEKSESKHISKSI